MLARAAEDFSIPPQATSFPAPQRPFGFWGVFTCQGPVKHLDTPRTRLTVFGDRLAQVFARFKALGIDLDRGRLKAYATAFAAPHSADRATLWSGACEVDDLMAAASLSDDALEAVRDRLPELCAGDIIFTDESGLDQGRNLCFELVTAAKLAQMSGKPSALQNPADAVNNIDGTLLLAECKRPSTLKGLARCLTEGYRQLSEHRRAGVQGVGVLSVEVTSLVNPRFDVLVAPSREAAMDGLYAHILKVFEVSKEYLDRGARNARKDANVQMMMFRAKCMTGNGRDPPDITTVWQLQPLIPLDSRDFVKLYRHLSNHPDFTQGIWHAEHQRNGARPTSA